MKGSAAVQRTAAAPRSPMLIAGAWRYSANEYEVVDSLSRRGGGSRRTVKTSGIGREGPKYAIRDMTDERLIA